MKWPWFQNQWQHFGIGAPPILVYFSGDWDVHWGYGVLTHGQMLALKCRNWNCSCSFVLSIACSRFSADRPRHRSWLPRLRRSDEANEAHSNQRRQKALGRRKRVVRSTYMPVDGQNPWGAQPVTTIQSAAGRCFAHIWHAFVRLRFLAQAGHASKMTMAGNAWETKHDVVMYLKAQLRSSAWFECRFFQHGTMSKYGKPGRPWLSWCCSETVVDFSKARVESCMKHVAPAMLPGFGTCRGSSAIGFPNSQLPSVRSLF